MEAAITVPFSVRPLTVTRAGNSSLLRFFMLSNSDLVCGALLETAECLDDFETKYFIYVGVKPYRTH